jgi:hypothetical protein
VAMAAVFGKRDWILPESCLFWSLVIGGKDRDDR